MKNKFVANINNFILERSEIRARWVHYLPPLGAGDEQSQCSGCGLTADVETPFCAWCGRAMTDEAEKTLLNRLGLDEA